MRKTKQAASTVAGDGVGVGGVGEQSEQIVVDHERGRWGAVPLCLLEDRRVSLSTRAILVWFVTRGETWKFHRSQFLCALGIGLDGWQAARRQMIAAGYLVTRQTRLAQGRFSPVVYKLNPYAAELELGAAAPGVARPGGARPGATGPGQARPLPTRSVSTQCKTTQPPRAGATPVVGGGGDQGQGQEQEQHGKQGGPLGGAVAPSGAGGLGGLLAGLLAPSVVVRVDGASVGASPEQLQLASSAFRSALAAGRVRSVPGLAMQLARLAARGEVTPPAGAAASGSGSAPPDPWPARAASAGSWVFDPADGGVELYVEPGGKSWRRRGGNLVVGGAAALRLWERVEAGELALHS